MNMSDSRVALIPDQIKNGNTLSITTAGMTDSGNYMCIAENQFGTVTYTVVVTVSDTVSGTSRVFDRVFLTQIGVALLTLVIFVFM